MSTTTGEELRAKIDLMDRMYVALHRRALIYLRVAVLGYFLTAAVALAAAVEFHGLKRMPACDESTRGMLVPFDPPKDGHAWMCLATGKK